MATYTYSERSDISRASAAQGTVRLPGEVSNRLPAPTGSSLSGFTMTTGTMTWNAVSGADPRSMRGYTVQRKLDGTNQEWTTLPSSVLTGATTASLTGMVAGNAYLYRVKANHPTDRSRDSNYANPVTGITVAPVGDTRLVAPTGMNIDMVTSNTAGTNWRASTGAVGYEVQWKLASQDNWQRSGRLGTSLSYTIRTLEASANWQARVRALANNPQNNSQWSSPVSFMTRAVATRPAVNRIDTPSNIRRVEAGELYFVVECDPVTNNRGYEWNVQRVGSSSLNRLINSSSARKRIDGQGIRRDTAYRVRVRALKNLFTGDQVGDSSWSAWLTISTTAQGTSRALPRMTATARVNEPRVTIIFSFPGGDSSVAAGDKGTIVFTIQTGTVTKVSDTIPFTASAGGFTVTKEVTGFAPPTFPYGDYTLKWQYTLGGRRGPAGTRDFLLPRRAGVSSIFTGSMVGGTRTRGSVTEAGYRKGQFGAVSPAGSPITGIYQRTTARGGFIPTQVETFINISGTWSQVTIGGTRWNRSEVAQNKKVPNRPGIPTQNGQTASIILK